MAKSDLLSKILFPLMLLDILKVAKLGNIRQGKEKISDRL